ncbi:hypothetical protein GGS21DRAFT_510311 [Xylaria nigripes]|nr:hypothetical protein GGS21DRAFT_510311 [Xylaria nigripes]
MKPTRAKRFSIEIPLPSKPRDYRPGDGPPLAPICLSLKNDAGAFIVDKRVLPGRSSYGDLKLELYYVVGWPDLPAARASVLATQILNYVSPRTLEDWEYKYSLEKDEERAEQERQEEEARRLKREKRAKLKQAAIPAESGSVSPSAGIMTPSISRRRKHKKLSKAEMFVRHITEQTSFGEDELANVPLPPAGTHGPSLSTPKKRLPQIADDFGDSETDTNFAIAQQLCMDSQDDSESHAAEDSEMLEGSGIGMDFSSLNCFMPGSSASLEDPFRSTSKNKSSRKGSKLRGPGRPKKTLEPSSKANRVPARSRPSSRPNASNQPATVDSGPTPPYQSSRPDVLIQMPRIESLLASSNRSSSKPSGLKQPPRVSYAPASSHQSIRQSIVKQPPVVSETPVPALSYPAPKQKSGTLHAHGFTPILASASSTAQSKVSHQVASFAHLQERSKSSGPSKSHKVSNTAISPPSPFRANRTSGSEERVGFTPIQYNLQIEAPSNGATPPEKSGSTRKRKRPQPDQEPEWEIKRLEDDRIIETGGQLVRFFKVRWKGNWPPDQNPSWEPEANIEQEVVRKYLKTKENAARRDSPPTKTSQSISNPARKYSSVAEAFAGGLDE